MNKLSPEQESANDQLCRNIFAAASASKEQMDAAADAPFLYRRIRNEIAQRTAVVPPAPKRTLFAGWFDWRWAGAAFAVLLLAVGLWQLVPRRSAVPVARQASAPSPAPTMQFSDSGQASAAPTATPIVRASHRAAPAQARKLAPPHQRQQEVTSEFIPLTYVADSAATGGHLIRIEVTPATLASLGFPMQPNNNKSWVKADVMLGDDGLARAIRFVQ